jgi:LysM repeat protein
LDRTGKIVAKNRELLISNRETDACIMNDKLKFETTDLVKLIILLVLILIAAVIYSNQIKTETMANREIELLPIEHTATAQAVTDKQPEIDKEVSEEQAGESIESGEQFPGDEGNGEGEAGEGITGEEGSDSTETGELTGETTPGEQPVTGETGTDYPPVPPSDQELIVVTAEGKITTSDGTVVYYLSVDRMVWVPAVPAEYSESTSGAAPQQDTTGNWYLPGKSGEYEYLWNPEDLTWIAVDDQTEVSLAEPGSTESGPEAGSDSGETEPSSGEETSPEQPVEGQETTSDLPSDTTSGDSQTSAGSGQEVAEQPGQAAEAIPTPVVKTPKTYTLRTGEHVYCIGRRFNLDPYSILRVNNLRANVIIRAGTVLKLPQYGGSFPGNRALTAHPAQYTVKKGDSIFSIACLFGDVTPEAIAVVNQLAAPYTLSIGQILYIP